MAEQNSMFEEKIKLMLEMQEKKNEQNLSMIRAALKKLAEEIDEIKATIAKIEIPKEKQQPLKTETKQENPRQGKYQSEDVDIQKMFYYGKK